MRDTLKYILFPVMASLFAAGCAAPKIALKRNFFEQKNAVIGVIVEENPPWNSVEQDPIFGPLCTNRIKEDRGAFGYMFDDFETEEPDNLRERVCNKLTDAGFKIKHMEGLISWADIEEFKGKGSDHQKNDIRPLKEYEGIDYLLSIYITDGVFVRRDPLVYLRFAKCLTWGELVDLSDNKVIWRFTDYENIAPLSEGYDQKNKYAKLGLVMNELTRGAIQEIENDLFLNMPR